ncbi:MAG: S-layer homology domain-containing protein [Bacillota bacterium]
MKKVCFMLLVLCFVLTLSYSPATADEIPTVFSDLTGTHWSFDMVKALTDKKWINGYPDNTFRPEQNVTRSELAAMIARASGSSNSAITGDPVFSDVSSADWFYTPVSISQNYFTNDPSLNEGLFRPGDLATRQEAASAIAMAAGLSGSDPENLKMTFSDYDSILPVYRGIISTAFKNGLVKGDTGGTLRPVSYLTRAEAAAMIYNAFFKSNDTIVEILKSYNFKAFSQNPEEFRTTGQDLKDSLGILDNTTLDFYIQRVPEGDIILVFARIDPFKYFSFSDVTLKGNPDKVKSHAERIAIEASSMHPGERIVSVIGYANITFYNTAPDVYGSEYTQYSKEEGGWRITRYYAAAMGQDGKITETWVEKD